MSWFLKWNKTLNPSNDRLAGWKKILGKFLDEEKATIPRSQHEFTKDEPCPNEFLSWRDRQQGQEGQGGAFDKGRGPAIPVRHSSKPLRPRISRQSMACLMAQTLWKPWGAPMSARQASPAIPQGSALDFIRLSPFFLQLGWSRTEDPLIKFAADTKPEGSLIERMAESRFENILTGWNNRLKTCIRNKCKFLNLGCFF